VIPTSEILESHGLRCTRQRELLYRALVSTKSHPTAEELLDAVHAHEPGLSLATVYNTLEAFVAKGIARRLPVGNGPSRYDGDTNAHLHVLTPGGRFLDVPGDVGRRVMERIEPELVTEIERRMGVRVRGVRIEILGDIVPEANDHPT
jgi:Fe2+ or Zn2+ uptake regulation protein